MSVNQHFAHFVATLQKEGKSIFTQKSYIEVVKQYLERFSPFNPLLSLRGIGTSMPCSLRNLFQSSSEFKRHYYQSLNTKL